MSIAVDCDCGRSLKLKDDLAGRKVRCPDCASTLLVPSGEADFEVVEELPVVRARVAAPAPR